MNEEAKGLTCMTHGHELRQRDCWREEGYRTEGDGDYCNSKINKTYLKNKFEFHLKWSKKIKIKINKGDMFFPQNILS